MIRKNAMAANSFVHTPDVSGRGYIHITDGS